MPLSADPFSGHDLDPTAFKLTPARLNPDFQISREIKPGAWIASADRKGLLAIEQRSCRLHRYVQTLSPTGDLKRLRILERLATQHLRRCSCCSGNPDWKRQSLLMIRRCV